MAKTFDVPEEISGALGAEVWRPNWSTKAGRTRPRYNPVYLFVLLSLAAVLGSVSLFNFLVIGEVLGLAGLGVATGIPVYLLLTMRRRVRLPVLSVHEEAILVPQTVVNIPGMQKVGGPAVLLRPDIVGVARIEDGDTLVVLVRTRSEFTGLVDRPVDSGISPEVWRNAVDGLCAAIEGLGIVVQRGGLELAGPLPH